MHPQQSPEPLEQGFITAASFPQEFLSFFRRLDSGSLLENGFFVIHPKKQCAVWRLKQINCSTTWPGVGVLGLSDALSRLPGGGGQRRSRSASSAEPLDFLKQPCAGV
jgi:hypothetical protein